MQYRQLSPKEKAEYIVNHIDTEIGVNKAILEIDYSHLVGCALEEYLELEKEPENLVKVPIHLEIISQRMREFHNSNYPLFLETCRAGVIIQELSKTYQKEELRNIEKYVTRLKQKGKNRKEKSLKDYLTSFRNQ